MYHHISDTLQRADEFGQRNKDLIWAELRSLPIDDFVHAIYYKPSHFKNLYRLLPSLPSEADQNRWVGEAGPRLEQMTASFVRNFDLLVRAHFGDVIPKNMNILDYGCGWGRILRMMTRYSDPAFLYGVDPMSDSLDLCKSLGVSAHFAQCDSIPKNIAFDTTAFDIVYAFSVFTHLSEDTALAVLRAVRQRIADRGLMIVTIRPVEFWEVVEPRWGAETAREMERLHREDRYAFVPVTDLAVNGVPTYGDTSFSLTKLSALAHETGWKVSERYERSVVDPYQIIVSLTPA